MTLGVPLGGELSNGANAPSTLRAISALGLTFWIWASSGLEQNIPLGELLAVGVHPDVGVHPAAGVHPDVGVHPFVRGPWYPSQPNVGLLVARLERGEGWEKLFST